MQSAWAGLNVLGGPRALVPFHTRTSFEHVPPRSFSKSESREENLKRFLICLALLALTFGAASASWADVTGTTAVSAGPINVQLSMTVPPSVAFPAADPGTTQVATATVNIDTNNAAGVRLRAGMLGAADGKLIHVASATKMLNPLQYKCNSTTPASLCDPAAGVLRNFSNIQEAVSASNSAGALSTVVGLQQVYATTDKAGVVFTGTIDWWAQLL